MYKRINTDTSKQVLNAVHVKHGGPNIGTCYTAMVWCNARDRKGGAYMPVATGIYLGNGQFSETNTGNTRLANPMITQRMLCAEYLQVTSNPADEPVTDPIYNYDVSNSQNFKPAQFLETTPYWRQGAVF